MEKETKEAFSPLPILFMVVVFSIAVMNVSNFKRSLAESREAHPDSLQSALQAVEGNYIEKIDRKSNFLDLNGAFSRLLLHTELNNVVKLNNNMLTLLVDPMETEEFAQQAGLFRDYLSISGIPFVYIQAPDVLLQDDDPQLPSGYQTFVNENCDILLEQLQEQDIDTLDLRENMRQDNIDPFSIFFRTDHHWTIEGSFYAYTQMIPFLEKYASLGHIDESLFSMDSYYVEVNEDIFLGSNGKRTGVPYAGVDNVTVIYPKEETQFQVEYPTEGIDFQGSFQEVLINFGEVQNMDYKQLHTRNPYVVYPFHSDYTILRNELAENDLKLFFLRDSFMAPVASFLAQHYKEIHLFDLRYGSVDLLIEQIAMVQPDLVVQINSAAGIGDVFFQYLTQDALDALAQQ